MGSCTPFDEMIEGLKNQIVPVKKEHQNSAQQQILHKLLCLNFFIDE
jgi:hypothetical protein